MKIAALIIIVMAALIQFDAAAQDIRYCTDTPIRDENGKIKRSQQLLAEFKRLHPCPSTGKARGACPGWAIDHVIPLAVGGCDAIFNLQWLPDSIKSCASDDCKDRWERDIYRRI